MASGRGRIRKAKAKVQTAKGANDLWRRQPRGRQQAPCPPPSVEDEVLKVMERAGEGQERHRRLYEDHVVRCASASMTRISASTSRSPSWRIEAAQRATGRDQIVAQIDPALLRRYEHVRSVGQWPRCARACAAAASYEHPAAAQQLAGRGPGHPDLPALQPHHLSRGAPGRAPRRSQMTTPAAGHGLQPCG